MTKSNIRIRLAAVALAAAGVLFLLYPAFRPWNDETTVGGAVASMSSNAWVAAHFFAMLGFILVPLGFLGVRATLAGTSVERLALVAAVITWIGVGLTLPYYGAEDFGLHAIASQAGPGQHLLDVVQAVRYQPLAITIFVIGLLSLGVGAVLAAIAVWRSGVLPRFSGVLAAAGFALFIPQFFTPAPVRIGHGVLMAAGLVILAISLWRSPA